MLTKIKRNILMIGVLFSSNVEAKVKTDDIDVVRERYESLYRDSNVNYNIPFVKRGYQQYLDKFERANTAAANYYSNPTDTQYKFTTKESQSEARAIFDVLKALTDSYVTHGPKNSPNPYFKSEKTKQHIFKLLKYLRHKGFKPGFNLGRNRQQVSDALDQLGFIGFGGTIYNQLNGYPYTILMLEKELDKSGMLESELEMLAWCNDIFMPPPAGEKFPGEEYPGYNSDGIRKLIEMFLPYVLLMDRNDPERKRYMDYFHRYMEKSCMITPGMADTYKPDGTGYHHKGIYMQGYSPGTYNATALVAYLLNRTRYALSETSINSIKNGLLTLRLMSNKYDLPDSVGGRFTVTPSPDGVGPVKSTMNALAFLGCDKIGLGDKECAQAFQRLWDEERITIPNPIKAQMAYNLSQSSVKAEPAPEGNWVKPYGALSIHRRDEWMAMVKGQSKYMWNYESGAKSGQRYHISSGALTLFVPNNKLPSRMSSGYALPGWDWEMMPGATVPYLKTDNSHYKSADRSLTDQAYVGGVSFEKKHGLFAMKYRFIPSAKDLVAGKYPTGKGYPEANKSYFFFDDQIIMLGSGINSQKEWDINTTLFQTALQSESHETKLNGASLKACDFKTDTLEGPVWLTDSVGNGFYIPDASKLKVTRKTVKKSNKTLGLYTTAWFAHGQQPADDSYEYATLVQYSDDKIKDFAHNAQSIYRVIRHDNTAHIVAHLRKKVIGYAIYEAGEVSKGTVQSVDKPCMIMLGHSNQGGLKISICNPDFGWVPPERSLARKDLKVKPLLYIESEVQPVQVSLKGRWELKNKTPKARIIAQGDNTTIEFACIDASTLEAELIR